MLGIELRSNTCATMLRCVCVQTKESLQYAFVEFEEAEHCENAYFKMDNVLIDDRRIHVDFSQSVSKMRYNSKGMKSKMCFVLV